MNKKKKRLIILSAIAGVLVFLILLSSAVFKIRGVSVEYQTTLTILSTEDLNSMVDNANLPVGKSIFFASMEESKAKMERENPYVKINGIERKFPNALVVMVSERVPVVKVEQNGVTYILDNELKILNIAATAGEFNAETGEMDLPTLEVDDWFGFNIGDLAEGEFVSNDQIRGYVDSFYRGAVAPGRDDSTVAVSEISSIENIQVSYVQELGKVQFFIEFKETSLTSTIVGDNNLTDNIYKVVGVVDDALKRNIDYEYVNCADGTIYAKER